MLRNMPFNQIGLLIAKRCSLSMLSHSNVVEKDAARLVKNVPASRIYVHSCQYINIFVDIICLINISINALINVLTNISSDEYRSL